MFTISISVFGTGASSGAGNIMTMLIASHAIHGLNDSGCDVVANLVMGKLGPIRKRSSVRDNTFYRRYDCQSTRTNSLEEPSWSE